MCDNPDTQSTPEMAQFATLAISLVSGHTESNVYTKTKVYTVPELADLAEDYFFEHKTGFLRGHLVTIRIPEAVEAVVTEEYPLNDDNAHLSLWGQRADALGPIPQFIKLEFWGTHPFPVFGEEITFNAANLVRAHVAAAVQAWLENDLRYEAVQEESESRNAHTDQILAKAHTDAMATALFGAGGFKTD